MHSEWGTMSGDTAAALNAARADGARVVAVGTTSLRLLESAATEDGTVAPFAGETAIFITRAIVSAALACSLPSKFLLAQLTAISR
jgi:S-adenosylmethionine:tRNA-ribosyltransferase-isomerase (queuine synthetase)